MSREEPTPDDDVTMAAPDDLSTTQANVTTTPPSQINSVVATDPVGDDTSDFAITAFSPREDAIAAANQDDTSTIAVTIPAPRDNSLPSAIAITTPSPQDDAIVAADRDDTSAVAVTIPAPCDDSVPTAVSHSPDDISTLSPVNDIDNSTWPSWFKNGFVPLKAAKLGEKWESLLVKYIGIEARAGFINLKGAAHAFGKDKRPAEVEWWIGRARKPKPVIKDVAKFEDSFWAWWKRLQLQWHD